MSMDVRDSDFSLSHACVMLINSPFTFHRYWMFIIMTGSTMRLYSFLLCFWKECLIPGITNRWNRWSEMHSINQYQSIKLVNWYRLVSANRWPINSHKKVIDWHRLAIKFIDCHRLAINSSTGIDRQFLSWQMFPGIFQVKLSCEARSFCHFVRVSSQLAFTWVKKQEETEKSLVVSKSVHCNFFLTKWHVPGMFDVCFVKLLLIL